MASQSIDHPKAPPVQGIIRAQVGSISYSKIYIPFRAIGGAFWSSLGINIFSSPMLNFFCGNFDIANNRSSWQHLPGLSMRNVVIDSQEKHGGTIEVSFVRRQLF